LSGTLALRTRFNAVEAKFKIIDRLVLQFGTTATGLAMVSAYQAARVVRDLGAGPSPQPPTPPPPGP